MIDEEKSTQLNPIYVWAIAAEYFTIMQTCQLLRVSVNRIRAYIERDDDPMPFRCFPGQTKGYFIHKDDLREWLMRNTYARIFGFCKDTGGSFWESRRGTAEFLGISERQVNRDMRKLEEDGLIEAIGEWRLPNGRISKRYEVTDEPVRKALRVVARRHDPSLFDP